jgi:hypothetical protein
VPGESEEAKRGVARMSIASMLTSRRLHKLLCDPFNYLASPALLAACRTSDVERRLMVTMCLRWKRIKDRKDRTPIKKVHCEDRGKEFIYTRV